MQYRVPRLNQRNVTRRFYDRISRAYDFIADSSERRIRNRGIRQLHLRPGQCVLEIGCGTGQGLLAMGRAVGDGGWVQGLDLSDGMLRVARTRIAGATNTGVAIGDARSLCFLSGAFDVVFLGFTLELFDADMPKVLAEIRRVLGAGGRIGIVAMEKTSRTNPMVTLYKWLHRWVPHVVDCQPIEVTQVLRDAGFKIVRVHTATIWGLPVVAVVAVAADEMPLMH